MVLSSAYSTPPACTPSKPPTLEESLVKLNDTLVQFNAHLVSQNMKLELALKRLTASTANLVAMNSHQIGSNNTRPSIHQDTHIANTTTNSCETTIEPEIISKEVVTQTICPILNVTTTTTTNDVVNKTSSRFTDIKSPKKSAPVIPFKVAVSATHMIKCLISVETKPTSVENICFKDMLNYFARHRCKPHAPVFLRAEPKPPWERHEPRYKIMILEDKDRFQAWGIDTS